MDKRQLRDLMPLNKEDGERAKQLASLGYPRVKPVAYQMLQWLRTDPSPVAEVFIEFFVSNAFIAAEDVARVLNGSRHSHLRYVVVTRLLPDWPRNALESLKPYLAGTATHSDEPETALMAIRLLAIHDLSERERLRGWLEFISKGLERNLAEAHQIATTYL